MATVRLGRGYFYVRKHLPADIQRATLTTLATMEADASLPGEADLADSLPPGLACWRRRVGATAWWVYFLVDAQEALVIGVGRPP